MGLSLSLLSSAWNQILRPNLLSVLTAATIGKVVVRSPSFGRRRSFKKQDSDLKMMMEAEAEVDVDVDVDSGGGGGDKVLVRSMSFTDWGFASSDLPNSPKTEEKSSVVSSNQNKSLVLHEPIHISIKKPAALVVPELKVFFSPRPVSELDAAATTLQKVYKSYRTRRNLADCAVVVEELWWKTLDAAALKKNSVLFFDGEKHETAVSKWTRATKRVAVVGKGLVKDEKAQKLALQHWLEAIDPRHRYGHNLHFYYDVWFGSKSTQPFFYWLDIGDGKELNLERCSRVNLQKQCILYLGPKERECYKVIVDEGKLVYMQSGKLLHTEEGSKWIFVLSTSRGLYVGQKKKGVFQHSSFLSGAATSAAGRLIAQDGILQAIWPYSGHYLPTEDNFKEFISFLEEHNVDLTNVKRCSIDDEDSISDIKTGYLPEEEEQGGQVKVQEEESQSFVVEEEHKEEEEEEATKVEEPAAETAAYELSKRRMSCKWNSGVGPRIGCVRDYPPELQFRALEQVNLSPRVVGQHNHSLNLPIPSPRPSPKIRLSPRLAYMGLPSPRLSVPSTA